MSDEKKERRINIEDLPQAEHELTSDDAKQVKGGLPAIQAAREVSKESESSGDIIIKGSTIKIN